jgi:mRNA interferase MazF
MTYKPFDIVVVPFPFSDELGKHKHRPALVLSSKDYNQKNHHLILAMITSAKNSNFWSDYKITDYKGTNLQNDCVVRMKLFTVDATLIKNKIGALNKSDADKIKKNLRTILQS